MTPKNRSWGKEVFEIKELIKYTSYTRLGAHFVHYQQQG